MNTILWIIQILRAILFTLFALMLLTPPREKNLEKATWAKNFSLRTEKGFIICKTKLMSAPPSVASRAKTCRS